MGDAPEKGERTGAVEESKFNAWKSQVGKSPTQATKEYIMLVTKISEKFDIDELREKAKSGVL
jgi:acyl-CoA-binding protein